MPNIISVQKKETYTFEIKDHFVKNKILENLFQKKISKINIYHNQTFFKFSKKTKVLTLYTTLKSYDLCLSLLEELNSIINDFKNLVLPKNKIKIANQDLNKLKILEVGELLAAKASELPDCF
jgi:hypothetical protein